MRQNLWPNALAKLCGAALKKFTDNALLIVQSNIVFLIYFTSRMLFETAIRLVLFVEIFI